MDSKNITNFTDVQPKLLGADLQTLGQEIVDGDTYVNGVTSTYKVDTDKNDIPTLTLTIEVTPTHESMFDGGYEVPIASETKSDTATDGNL
jgi:hypothetical protein